MSTTTPNAEKGTDHKPLPEITGPHPERSSYGGYTGHWFYRCEGCGAEWLTDARETHRDGCPHEW